MPAAGSSGHVTALGGTGRPGTLPRLLPGIPAAGPVGLSGHLARYGPSPSALSRQRRRELIAQVGRAGLTGRGGAGFPAAGKLAAVAAGRAPVVIANGTEGEPASAKDKVLMARSPHLVLDGAVLAAELVGAREAVLVVHRRVREIMDEAAAERRHAHLDRVRVTIRTAADRFAGGEASAVVHWIEHGVPTPAAKPPRLSERGLDGRPTLVHNVETLAHLALIARYGAAWFRSVGTSAEPGSMLVTVLGAVREPCVLEIAIGTPVGQISSVPRWLFLRMAVLVTLVLWLPDLYILAKGEPLRAVAVLMVMHLAIAVVTYNCLVRIARVEPAEAARTAASGPDRYASRRM